jgi:hypothetical protein
VSAGFVTVTAAPTRTRVREKTLKNFPRCLGDADGCLTILEYPDLCDRGPTVRKLAIWFFHLASLAGGVAILRDTESRPRRGVAVIAGEKKCLPAVLFRSL